MTTSTRSVYHRQTDVGRLGESRVAEALRAEGISTTHPPYETFLTSDFDQVDLWANGKALEVKHITNSRFVWGAEPESFTGSRLLVAKKSSIEKHRHPRLAYVFAHTHSEHFLVLPYETCLPLFRDNVRAGWSAPNKCYQDYCYLDAPQKYLKNFDWLVTQLKCYAEPARTTSFEWDF